MLKFMAEFVMNKTQRLTFDSSSPNGILLFREVSKARAVPPPCLIASLTILSDYRLLRQSCFCNRVCCPDFGCRGSEKLCSQASKG